MNTQKTAPDFGEPWNLDTGDDDILIRSRFGQVVSTNTLERIVSCVNACAGMSDPAAEIQALRDTVNEAREAFEDLMSLLPDVPPWAHTEATLALSKLQSLA